MIVSYEDYCSVEYDSDLAREVYEIYLEEIQLDGTSSVTEEFVIVMLPLVRKVFNIEIVGDVRQHRSTLEGNAIAKIFTILVQGTIPPTNLFSTKFFYNSIKYNMINDIKAIQPPPFDYWKICNTPHCDANNRLNGKNYVESKVFTEQVLNLTRKISKERVRFVGNDREACLFMLDCCLGFINKDVDFAKSKFSLKSKRFKYLLQYVKILIKYIRMDIYEQER